MLDRDEIRLAAPTMPLKKLAQKEGAEAARLGRARSSNPYPPTYDIALRQGWFRGYDQLLANRARNR
jgi:hypothetical protein